MIEDTDQPYHGPDAVARQFQSLADLWHRGEIRLWSSEEQASESVEAFSESDGELPVHDALHRWVERYLDGAFDITKAVHGELTLYDAADRVLGSFSLEIYLAENNSFDLFFEDRSTVSALNIKGSRQADAPPEDEGKTPGGALDTEEALRQPITAIEYGTVEEVIGLLHGLEDSPRLTELDAWKLRAVIELLEGAHRLTEVGATKRYELWAVTKQVMRYIYKELPVDIVKWSTAAAVIRGVWPMLGDFLRSL